MPGWAKLRRQEWVWSDPAPGGAQADPQGWVWRLALEDKHTPHPHPVPPTTPKPVVSPGKYAAWLPQETVPCVDVDLRDSRGQNQNTLPCPVPRGPGQDTVPQRQRMLTEWTLVSSDLKAELRAMLSGCERMPALLLTHGVTLGKLLPSLLLIWKMKTTAFTW